MTTGLIIGLTASLVLAVSYGVYATIMWRRTDKQCDELIGNCEQFAEILMDIAKGEADATIVNGDVVCQRRAPRAYHRKTPIH